MRSTLILVFCGCAAAAFSQVGAGTIAGSVTDPEGNPFGVAFIALKNTQTGKTLNTGSAEDGKYSLEKIAPGTYDLTINVPGMKPFKREGIAVRSGETLQIDARVQDGLSLRTLGEDPASIAAVFINRPNPPKGRTPRGPGGKPDLSGMWLTGPVQLEGLDMLPWAEALTKERTESQMKDHPMARCLPGGPLPLLSPGWVKFVHSPATLVMLIEDEPGYRQIFLDGRAHPKDFGPSWLGHSVGKWEGDTLVIDTIGFHDRGWLGFEGQPHTDKMHVTQRIRRPNLGSLELQITVDDPGAYRKPWTVNKGAFLAPDQEILEYICNENNRDVIHIVGK